MPRLVQEPQITTVAEVTLSTKLVKQLKAKLTEMRELRAQKKLIDAKMEGGKDEHGEEIPGLKAEIETLFADAGEYDALESGVRIETPFGEVPVKLIKPEPGKGAFNEKKMLTTFYVKKGNKFVEVTQADLDRCRNKPSEKTPYLGVYLPKEDANGGDE
jgi:hypothetical protein